MPNSKHQLIRLLATVICSSAILGFTIIETKIQTSFFAHIGDAYPVNPAFSACVMFFYEHGWWVFIVPLSALVIGIWMLYRHPQSLATFEILIFSVWLLTIAFVGFYIIGWQYQYMDLEWKNLYYIKHRDKM